MLVVKVIVAVGREMAAEVVVELAVAVVVAVVVEVEVAALGLLANLKETRKVK